MNFTSSFYIYLFLNLLIGLFGFMHCKNPSATVQTHSTPISATVSNTIVPSSTHDDSVPTMLKPGDLAPTLATTTSNGTRIDVQHLNGKWLVLYFYPKDDTPGCTKEACAIRDAWAQFAQQGVLVVGVSFDDDASHKSFVEKYKLPFPLIADTDGAIAKKFGVPIKGSYPSRVSFLIGPDGHIKKVYPKVDPALHAAELLLDVKNAS